MSAARLPSAANAAAIRSMPCSRVSSERRAATSARSLSPRPERQTRSSASGSTGGLASTQAIACALSSAGMIPSSARQVAEGGERLASVTAS